MTDTPLFSPEIEKSNSQEVLELIQRAKAVIFDHNDTLVATMQAKWAQHKYIASQFYGKKLSNQKLRMHWGLPSTSLLRLLYETDHVDIATSYKIATRERFPKFLFKDTLDTLKALRAAGKKLGIVTASTLSSILYDFDTLKIPRQMIDYLQTEDDTIFHKPDPRVFDPAVKWLIEQDISPSEVIYIGDHSRDLTAAKGAGFDFVGIASGVVTLDEFAKLGVLAVSKLSELIEKSPI